MSDLWPDAVLFVQCLEDRWGPGSLFVKVGAALAAGADQHGFISTAIGVGEISTAIGVSRPSVRKAIDVLLQCRFLYDSDLAVVGSAWRVSIPRWVAERAA